MVLEDKERIMPIRFNWGDYNYDLHYTAGHMSVSMKMLKERLNKLLEPFFKDQGLKWWDSYFVWFTKNGGDQGWIFCVDYPVHGILEIHIDGVLKRYYSGKIEFSYDHADRYIHLGNKKKQVCKTCKGFGFIRDDAWGYFDKCQDCEITSSGENS